MTSENCSPINGMLFLKSVEDKNVKYQIFKKDVVSYVKTRLISTAKCSKHTQSPPPQNITLPCSK